MLNTLLPLLLSLSLSGSVLIVVLFLCKPLYQKRLSRRWQYYIWLVVVARLLLPFTPEVNLTGRIFQNMKHEVPAEAPLSTSQPDSGYGQTVFPMTLQNPAASDGISEPASWFLSSAFQRLYQQAGSLWFLVAVGLLIRKITLYQSFVKYIAAGRAEVEDVRLWEQLGLLAKEAGIRSPVSLYTNSLISSPLLIGFFRPCILLPSADLPEAELRCTILHELTHYKRLDMFYKWLVQITVCIHWFNPLVYLMAHEINKNCELACDEAIIRKLDFKGKQAYGDTLLHAARHDGALKNPIASVTLNEGKKRLKERLDAIMTFKKSSGPMRMCTCLLTCLLLCAALFTGAYAAVPAVPSDLSKPASLPEPKRAGLPAAPSNTDRGYANWNVEEKNGSYYYQGDLTRIFMDLKSDRSFENFSFNRYGTIDLCLERDTNGVITTVRPLTQREADDVMLDLPSEALTPRQASLIESAAPYEEYGLFYSPSSDEMYYKGQLVRAFADIKEAFASGGYSFRLGYVSESDIGLYLMAARDTKGRLTGIETMPEELITELYGSVSTPETEKTDSGQIQDIDMIVFNATTQLLNNTVTATDKFASEAIPQDVQDWINSCQKAAQEKSSLPNTVYTKRTGTDIALDTWVYYGSKDKLAWFMEADGSILKIFMKPAPETISGATIIHYQSPLAYSELKVYYNNKELTVE